MVLKTLRALRVWLTPHFPKAKVSYSFSTLNVDVPFAEVTFNK